MELEPEVHAHSHKSGHSLVDLLLALSALVLSIVSMIIAIQNHHAMKELVMANSWPYLRHESSNVGNSGGAEVNLGFTNAGIGPALIEKFTVSYQGKPIKNTPDLLLHCCVKDAGDLHASQANRRDERACRFRQRGRHLSEDAEARRGSAGRDVAEARPGQAACRHSGLLQVGARRPLDHYKQRLSAEAGGVLRCAARPSL
jgi:hypothetical protein